ncbi:hypothetical protein CU098_006695 [Rhizopus stolonifer]|uniref:VASt domain-containing protein n=1 Tax=Rhizopus stolonifer TaxID=4846 RepID=A0A367K5Q8_RHIST|nr:hypothetical protein CU098_006695 [Rhizopus stolonifer]
MTDNSLKVDNDAKRTRHHSNTISGSRPPALDIAITRPTHVRRNSEGSPGVPPPICVSEPTPIEPSAEPFNFEQKNRPPTPNNDQVKQDSLSDSTPQQSKRSRSRASSLTSSLLNEIKESSTIQSLAHKIKSRHGSEDVDNESTVESTTTTAPATSIMTNNTIILANAKRNQDFHALFRSVPEEDSLIEDFGCALQKEILLQGRIYLSENHLCFNANIFGWVTNLVIAFADIVDIEKKTTAYFIPNAIQVSTETSKHFFASFLSRDQAYDLMVDIWHTVRPDLAPKDENDIQNEQESSSLDEDNSSSEYDSDTEDSYSDDLDSEVNATDTQAKVENRSRKVSMAGSLPAFKDVKHVDSTSRRRAQSELPRPNFQTMNEKAGNEKKPDGGSPDTKEEPKPQVHEKTECECGQNGNHYPNLVMDQVYNGTLDQLYNLLFDSDFMKDFLIDNQKSLELEMGDWKKTDGGNVLGVREYSYIKQLGGAIGPKQTKCYITQELLHHDLDNYVSVLSTTSTPDVPSGSSFTCKTRTCLTYAGKGKVRLTVTVQVEFTKSSWLKSTIEKASIDGQQTYYKDLDAVLRKHLSNAPSGRSGHGKKKRRRSKKSKHAKAHQDEAEPEPSKPKGMLDTIFHLLSDSLGSFSLNTSHMTLLCLIIMACINVFIARKMAVVEKQIDGLVHANDFENAATPHLPQDQRDLRYQPEADDLWAWLGSIDPEKSNQRPIAVVQNPEEQEAIWDEAIRYSKVTKERLDKHMIELNEMIQKAESNLESVTRSVNEQRQKMRQQDA